MENNDEDGNCNGAIGRVIGNNNDTNDADEDNGHADVYTLDGSGNLLGLLTRVKHGHMTEIKPLNRVRRYFPMSLCPSRHVAWEDL
ncbi:unnamed protein product [Protopolystoma xenopodis]|uniref:Uncharacterized protein n=1 Tax=Protopolystoma xenopodis TaxID=117903 RepID=A0A3S5AFQ1_9PLAT|nr:unnamed protein product [Protopolystoma xenopodis]